MKKTNEKIMVKAIEIRNNVSKILLDKKGEGAINVAITILISVILAALILAGLYALIGDVILPELQKKIMEMFNFNG